MLLVLSFSLGLPYVFERSPYSPHRADLKQKIRFRKNLEVGPFYPYQTSSTLFLLHSLWTCLFVSFYGPWWACNCTNLNAFFFYTPLVRLHEHNPREWLSHICTGPSVHPASFLPGMWERSAAVKPPGFSKVQFTTLHSSAFPGPPPVIGEMRLELLVCEGGWGNAGGLSAWSAWVKTKEIEAVCDSGSAWGEVVMERVHKTLSVSFVVLIYFSFPIFLSNFSPAFLKEPPSSCTLLERLYVKFSFLIWNKNPREGIRLNLV